MRVNPLAVFAGAIAYNLHEHKHDRPTACSTTRKFVPAALFVLGWCVLSGWLIPHYVEGFKIDLDNLTD